MEIWCVTLLTSLLLCVLVMSIFNLLMFHAIKSNYTLPPGPRPYPIIGNLLWFRSSAFDLKPLFLYLHAKFGPIVTFYMGSQPAVFIADRSIAHQALIQNGAVFADRPEASAVNQVISSNQRNISFGCYTPTWRLLRRNLTSEILHPSRFKSYAPARKWALQILLNRIESPAKSGHPVFVREHFHFSVSSLLVLMCFGDKLDENGVKQIQQVQEQIFLCFGKFNHVLNHWPRLTKILMSKQWEELFQIRRNQENVIIPLIKSRKKLKEEEDQMKQNDYVLSYVDTLLDLELPDEKRKLNDGEIVSLCSEVLNGGTDTTSTALQWIMANLVKYPDTQHKLFMEIKGVMKEGEEEVKEDDLQKLPYLKAVILEGLRRHPPLHFVVPHAVTEDAVLDNYLIPKKWYVNFMVAEMGRDPKVWENPMAFKPERFLDNINGSGEAFDITCSREIKMMPFGAGRRICPGYALAMLLLEYFVANLIWNFEWKSVDGEDDIDLSEKMAFTVMMKNPLQVLISPRLK